MVTKSEVTESEETVKVTTESGIGKTAIKKQ